MYDVHGTGEFGEKQSLFHRRVAAADDEQLFVLEEKSVTRGAG